MNLKSKGKPISAAIYQVELYQFSYRYPNCTSCADIQTVPVVRISKRPHLCTQKILKLLSSGSVASILASGQRTGNRHALQTTSSGEFIGFPDDGNDDDDFGLGCSQFFSRELIVGTSVATQMFYNIFSKTLNDIFCTHLVWMAKYHQIPTSKFKMQVS